MSSEVEVGTAIAKLRRMISDRSIQPRAVVVPIQIGEMLTMAGQSFTHLWMLGMNNEVLPGSPAPNPFIPISVQKRKQIPGSSPALLESLMTERIDRLLGNAMEVVQSYSITDGSSYHQPGRMLDSPVRVDFDRLADIQDYPDYWNTISNDRHLCARFTDWTASDVSESEEIRGGTSILKNQSQCPFRAFAEHRLHAGQPESPSIGISVLDKGSMVHEMFEGIYGELTSSNMLTDEKAYAEVARRHAVAVMEHHRARQIKPLDDDIAEVEIERMVDVAVQWFENELTRGDFRVVETEQLVETEFSGMSVRMKIDRVDETENGIVVIDYKTGNCNISDIDGPRPREPQLLMYESTLADQGRQVNDVAYAQLKRGDMRFISRLNRRNAPVVPVDESKAMLDGIARNFLSGKADVDPLRNACDYCHLLALCRRDDRSDHVAGKESDFR